MSINEGSTFTPRATLSSESVHNSIQLSKGQPCLHSTSVMAPFGPQSLPCGACRQLGRRYLFIFSLPFPQLLSGFSYLPPSFTPLFFPLSPYFLLPGPLRAPVCLHLPE